MFQWFTDLFASPPECRFPNTEVARAQFLAEVRKEAPELDGAIAQYNTDYKRYNNQLLALSQQYHDTLKSHALAAFDADGSTSNPPKDRQGYALSKAQVMVSDPGELDPTPALLGSEKDALDALQAKRDGSLDKIKTLLPSTICEEDKAATLHYLTNLAFDASKPVRTDAVSAPKPGENPAPEAKIRKELAADLARYKQLYRESSINREVRTLVGLENEMARQHKIYQDAYGYDTTPGSSQRGPASRRSNVQANAANRKDELWQEVLTEESHIPRGIYFDVDEKRKKLLQGSDADRQKFYEDAAITDAQYNKAYAVLQERIRPAYDNSFKDSENPASSRYSAAASLLEKIGKEATDPEPAHAEHLAPPPAEPRARHKKR